MQNPAVYGAAMAFEPGTFKTGDVRFCPYVYRGDGGLEQMDINADVYDWYTDEQWQWWHVPKATGRGAWSDPYYDEGAGNVLMVTWSEPFTRDGVFRGVTTVDIMLPTLRESIGGDAIAGLDFIILTAEGHYVYSRLEREIMGQTIFEAAAQTGRPDIEAAVRAIVSGKSGIAVLNRLEPDQTPEDWVGWTERIWVFYAPIESTGWAFAALLPERVALAAVRSRMTQAAVALTLTLVLIIGCIYFVSGRLAAPIRRLRHKVVEITEGNLDVHVDGITTRDEIGELADSFNRMTADLRTHVAQLAAEQANRQKVERDLDLARDIQRGLLPKTEPDVPGFEIAGWNQAADQTGGDYFDWLALPDGRLIVTLADVTGHGIGPALIVAVCRAYMRASTSMGDTALSHALSRVNDLLHEDIPDERFVTAVVGVLDPKTSSMSLVSAGQAPILFYEAAADTVHNWDADDLPLGVMPGLAFDDHRTIDFKPGDTLVLTTDGFFEWPNPAGEMFGTARLVDFVAKHQDLPPQQFIDALHRAVLDHADGVPQPDDLTAVVIRRT
jgi:sigma-B regulation protein RsbU (phosphoserine phosphatase)